MKNANNKYVFMRLLNEYELIQNKIRIRTVFVSHNITKYHGDVNGDCQITLFRLHEDSFQHIKREPSKIVIWAGTKS